MLAYSSIAHVRLPAAAPLAANDAGARRDSFSLLTVRGSTESRPFGVIAGAGDRRSAERLGPRYAALLEQRPSAPR